jgi:hypothetical protein
MKTINYYFNLWRTKVLFRKYDDWCENNNEELEEEQFAAENNMESIHWCWNCKYNECEIH